MVTVYDISKLDDTQLDTVYNSNTDENKQTNKGILGKHNVLFNTCSTENGTYRVLKYDKKFLTPDNVKTTGLFRSVILRNNNILSFSPPKSINDHKFVMENPLPGRLSRNYNNIVAEEYIEGTMINVFFDKNIGDEGDWEISTRSNIGARTAFFRDGDFMYEHTFRYMFLEAATKAQLCFDNLSKDLCYSFVLQHPKNRIVVPVLEPLIYLVACYKIDNNTRTVTEISRGEQIKMVENTMVCFPGRFSFESYDELKERYASGNTDYKVMGLVIKNLSTGERTKFRNPNYECVRKLRGNQPKLQYQYLTLRNDGNVAKYLKYFPEATESFTVFRNQVHGFTSQLHTNYIMCYVKKTKPLIEYPEQFRTHMFKLHKIYLDSLKNAKEIVTKKVVVDYVNELHPSKLMFSMNFHMRKRQIETIVCDTQADE